MPQPQVAPYGSWKSPITTDLIVGESVGLLELTLDGDDVYWIETRPREGGRCVIVRRTPDGEITDCNPPPFNARTRVHEYGGGAFTVADGAAYFSNFSDQRLYRVVPDSPPKPLTDETAFRYADGVLDGRRHRLLCVREDHTDSNREAINAIVSIDLSSNSAFRIPQSAIVTGCDFYSTPRLSPEGERLAWQEWNHPNMPWDGCRLVVAQVGEDGALANRQLIAGGDQESIFQPEWSPDGVLHFVSDRTGWWNLYRWRDGAVEALCPLEADLGRAQWVFGARTCAFESATRIICAFDGRLARLDTTTGTLEQIETAYTTINSLHVARGKATFIGASPTEPPSVVQLDLSTGAHAVLRRSSAARVDSGYVSVAQPLEFPTAHGFTAHAWYYPPRNRDFVPPPTDLPPLVVKSHGGPTSASSNAFLLETQYFTSRGFAVLDVNYGGSTGYGRAYRERLNGQWGIVDVDDCINAARYLVARGLADGERLAIRGGSAGGYTTLAALTFRNVFKAGASLFGISDLEAMATDTHKFESRYLDRLIGPYPERKDLYVERSPIHFVDRISCPMILLQGLEDKVVPPNQAELMVAALRAKGLPVAYVPFAGEQHGFRQAQNIKRALEAELFFYSQIFGCELADEVEPVLIENL